MEKEAPYVPGFGAIESACDARTIVHDDVFAVKATLPLVQGGHAYTATDIEHQHHVGICTSINLTQNARRALGRKYSADFQYLLQKKFIDGNWVEGSAILSALKVGKKYGFLPAEYWTHTTEADRNLEYKDYVAKLQAVSDAEINRLLALCVDNLTGYASVANDPQAIAQAVNDSAAGVLCMYRIGATWYTSPSGRLSWEPNDIDPLRVPNPIISGHAITLAAFDYTRSPMQVLANSWGATWNKEGLGDINWNLYQPREIWIPYYRLSSDQTTDLKNALAEKQNNPVPSPVAPQSDITPAELNIFAQMLAAIRAYIAARWGKPQP